MRILDCETIDTTYDSLGTILGLSHEELTRLFRLIDPDAMQARHPEGWPAQRRYLFSFIQEQTGCRIDFDATCWFHCTRTWGHAFEEGLLPHSLTQERVWEFLYRLVKDGQTWEQWGQIRESAMHSELYSERLRGGSSEDGPFGLLVRESAIAVCRSSVFVDYFDLPELVDNICRGVVLRDVDLKKEYIAHTKPTIVKFRTDCHRPDELQVALFYAYSRHYGLDVGMSCNWCYNGNGRVVPKERILKIEGLIDSTLG
jgi:hypothetical protein